MSWIFNGDSTFDAAVGTRPNAYFPSKQVEKATSEMIPAGQEDMALFLELCDRIRSRGVPPKDAMRSLKKRIGHKNPNVQLLALKSVNHEVKNKILALIQLWATAFKSRPDLSYVADTYDNLEGQGYDFPSLNEKLSEVMIDTTAPPTWTDSDVCERCRQLFTLTNRKHHCRSCGKTFCQACSSRNIALPDMGLNQNVRVCESCYNKRNKDSGSGPSTMTKSQSSLSASQQRVSSQTKEEEELQRAIALSLLESEKGKTSSRKVSEPEEVPVSAEEDPELAAAIAASLKDLKVKEKKQQPKKEVPSAYPSMEKSHSYGASSSAVAPQRSSSVSEPTPVTHSSVSSGSPSGLSSTEMQNVGLFHQLMEKMDSDPSGRASANILNDHDLRVLYDAMTAIHPKLVKNIEELVEQHRNLMDLHEKLTGAVGTYDKLVEERVKQQQQQQQQQQAPPPAVQPYGAAPGYYQPPPAGPYQHAYTHPYPHPAQAYNHQHYYAPPPATVTPTASNTPPPPGASPYQQPYPHSHPPHHPPHQAPHQPPVSSSTPSSAPTGHGYVAVSAPSTAPPPQGYYPGYYAPDAGYASPPPANQQHPPQPTAGQTQPHPPHAVPDKPLIEF